MFFLCDLLSLQEKSSDDESKRSLSPILVETVNIKKETLSDEGSKGSDEYCTQRPVETDQSDDESQNGIKLPGKVVGCSQKRFKETEVK